MRTVFPRMREALKMDMGGYGYVGEDEKAQALIYYFS